MSCQCSCVNSENQSPVRVSQPSSVSRVISYAQWFLPKISVAFDTPIKSKNSDGWFFDASFVSRAVIELPECNFQDIRCYIFSIAIVLYLSWKIWNYINSIRNQQQQQQQIADAAATS